MTAGFSRPDGDFVFVDARTYAETVRASLSTARAVITSSSAPPSVLLNAKQRPEGAGPSGMDHSGRLRFETDRALRPRTLL